MYSIWLASRPRDYNHPYGHGKIEFIYSGIEGGLVTIAGVVAVFKSTSNWIFNNNTVHDLDIGLYLISATAILNYIAGVYLDRKGKSTHSMTLSSGGKHLISDSISTLGIVIGGIIVLLTHQPWLDNLLGIGFGLWITYAGYSIIKKAVSGIMDEADEEILNQMIAILQENRKPDWIDIHNFRVIKYGAILHIDCHVTVPYYYNTIAGHDIIKEIEEIVNLHTKREIELFIHVDPCIETSCKICAKMDCEVRLHPLNQKVVWDLENVSRNKKH